MEGETKLVFHSETLMRISRCELGDQCGERVLMCIIALPSVHQCEVSCVCMCVYENGPHVRCTTGRFARRRGTLAVAHLRGGPR